MVWWIWIILGALLLVAEVIITTDFYIVFFGVAAVLVGVIGLLGLDLPNFAQFLLFAVLSVAGLVLYRSRLKQRWQSADRELGPEIVGERAVAREEITPGARGRVNLRGATWDAVNEGEGAIAAGVDCRVARVDGLTLYVHHEE